MAQILDFSLSLDSFHIGAMLLNKSINKLGLNKVSYHLYNDSEQYHQYIQCFIEAGFGIAQEKLSYRFTSKALKNIESTIEFCSYTQVGEEAFLEAVVTVTENTLDSCDAKALSEYGKSEYAKVKIDNLKDIDFQPDNWILAYEEKRLIGLVIPSSFGGGYGGINYIGIVPTERGKGYVNVLLNKGTNLLLEQGITTIIADIDTLNYPMKKALESCGYNFHCEEVVLKKDVLSMKEINFINEQLSYMSEIIEMYKKIKNINISLSKLYPITVIKDNYFYVFDICIASEMYKFKMSSKCYMPVPEEILSAFSLDFYENKASVVISKNVLKDKTNLPIIFHEFVHCFQLENGEIILRNDLQIEKQEKEKGNFMWELNYSFPYESPYFIEKTIYFDISLLNKDIDKIMNYFKEMKTYLSITEYEYMIWQMWKEGFADYIENLLRDKLNLNLKSRELKQPFTRVLFYKLGSKYIELIINRCKKHDNDIVELFKVIYGGKLNENI